MWADTLAVVRATRETFAWAGPVYEFGATPHRAFIDGPGTADGDPVAGGNGSCRYLTDGLHELTDLPCPDRAATTILCLNVLDRVPEPGRVIAQMQRILRPGGILIVCMSEDSSGEVAVPRYWRPTPAALQAVLDGFDGSLVGWQGTEGNPHTLFAVAAKAPVRLGFAQGAARFIERFDAGLRRAEAAVPWWHRASRWFARRLGERPHRPGDRDYHRARFVVHLPIDADFKREMLDACLTSSKVGTRVDLSQ